MRQPDERWLTKEQAARLLCVSPGSGKLLASIPHESRGNGSARGAGALFDQRILEHIMQIRRECRVTLACAIRVEAALREGRIREVLR